MTIIIAIQDGTTEQATGKIPIFLILKFGQEFLLVTVLRIKTLDRLQNKSIYNFLIVIPVQTLVFQYFIQSSIVENDLLIDLSPYLTVFLVRRSFAGHVFLINITFHDLLTQLLHKITFVFPGLLLWTGKFIQLPVDFQLSNEAVFYKFSVRTKIFLSRHHFTFRSIQSLIGILCNFDHQEQEIVI